MFRSGKSTIRFHVEEPAGGHAVERGTDGSGRRTRSNAARNVHLPTVGTAMHIGAPQ